MDTQSNQLRVEFTKADLRRLIVPLVIEQLLSITVGLSDSLMVSQVGEAAISAVSLVDTVNVLLVNAFAPVIDRMSWYLLNLRRIRKEARAG